VRISRLRSKGTPRRAALRLAVWCLFATAALWLCLELIFSYFVASWPPPLARIQFMTMTSRDFIVADADRGFRLQANYDSPTIRTNSLGFRGRELPRELTGKRLVLAVGESTTFGWAVNNDETYPFHLETILNETSADRGWVVLNAGVPS
jgi:hypothetical protein